MFDKRRDNKATEPRLGEPEMAVRPSLPGSSPPMAPMKAAVIGPGIVIDGDIGGSENLLIEGKVRGRIHLAAHEVTVGQSGEVQADISAKIIRVAGKIKGDLNGKEKVIISSTGNVHGNIVAPRMLLEDGAVFKGSIDMDPREPATPAATKPAAQASASSATPSATPSATSAAAKTGATHEASAAPNTSSKAPDLALKSG